MKERYNKTALFGVASDEIDPRELIAPGTDVAGKAVRAYSIAHEGAASVLLDRKKTYFSMTSGALKSVLRAINAKIPAMPFHEQDRADQLSHEGRVKIASVVGKKLVSIKGKLHALVALAFDSEEEAARWPRISLEALGFHIRNRVARTVEKITGLALLPEWRKPGFPESGAVSGVALCSPEEEPDRIAAIEAQIEELKRSEEKKPMTLQEIKDFISSNQIKPSQLFTSDDVFGEIVVKDGKLSFEDGDGKLTRPLLKIVNGHVLVTEEAVKEQAEKADKFDKIEKDYAGLARKELTERVKKDVDAILKKRGVAGAEEAKKYLLKPSVLATLEYTGDPDKDLDAYITRGLENFKLDADAAGSGDGPNSSGKPDGPKINDPVKAIQAAAEQLKQK